MNEDEFFWIDARDKLGLLYAVMKECTVAYPEMPIELLFNLKEKGIIREFNKSSL